MDDSRFLEFKIDAEHDDVSLHDILRYEYSFSVSQLRRIKKSNEYLILNEQPSRLSEKAHNGDVVKAFIGDDKDSRLIPIKGDVDIIYEDDDIAVIDKPAGIVSHPSPGCPTEPSIAGFMTYKWISSGKRCNFHAVNRLDRGTSGLMVAAKNGYSHNILSSYLHTDRFERVYLAVVCGIPEPKSGCINAAIDRDPNSIVKRRIIAEGAEAITYYNVVSTDNIFSIVKLLPMTGRTHQLRLHMSYIGHPLAGDFLYGKEDPLLIERPALHSAKCSFHHPTTNTMMEFISPMPKDMKSIMHYDK